MERRSVYLVPVVTTVRSLLTVPVAPDTDPVIVSPARIVSPAGTLVLILILSSVSDPMLTSLNGTTFLVGMPPLVSVK